MWNPLPLPPTLTSDDKNEAYVADPVTAPAEAGLLLTVFTLNMLPPGPSGPSTST